MFIRSFQTQRFGGLKDKNVNFEKGINVVLGRNEAGKSTLVDAIFAVFFKDINLRMSYKKDSEFKKVYMPYPSGDCIDGCVIFEFDGNEYRLEKAWGSKPAIRLIKPDGSIISGEAEAKNELYKIFSLGEATYQNIVFAKQRELKSAIEKFKDSETVVSVNSLLRNTIMDFDGVSAEKLRNEINNEHKRLLSKWDIDNNCPEGGRGINNPYKKELGEVIKSYYESENIRLIMDMTEKVEAEINKIKVQMDKAIEEKKEIEREIEKLSPIEGDAMKRAEVEPKIKALELEIKLMQDTAVEWPGRESELKGKLETLNEYNKILNKLKEEEKIAKKTDIKKEIEALLSKLQGKYDEIAKIKNQLAAVNSVTDDDIKNLEGLSKKISDSNSALEAGIINAQIKKRDDVEVFVVKGLCDREEAAGKFESANGFMKIKVGDYAEIDIKSGKFSYTIIKETYDKASKEMQDILKKLKINKLDDAKKMKKEAEGLNYQKEALNREIQILLNGKTIEEIKKEYNMVLSEIDKISNLLTSARSLSDISTEKNETEAKINKLQFEIAILENKIAEWKKKYGTSGDLILHVASKISEKRGHEDELKSLKELPERFDSALEFGNYLKGLRSKNQELINKYIKLRDDYFDKERQIPDESFEELKIRYGEKKKEFEKNINRSKKIIMIKSAFEKTMEEMGEDTFKPLTDSFSNYLNKITIGSYRLGKVNDEFELEIVNNNETAMPIHLLSSGTYDSVALAFRFALLDNIFESKGFLILDDCLVDLDPYRRKEAISIIKEYAQENQIIFTTCNPETAELLGGNIIKF